MVSVPLQPTKPTTKKYRVLVGINYRDQRAEPGDVVSDLTAGEAEWMLADGVIEVSRGS